MRIGTLSAQTGCNIETIRYYERIGIMDAPPRSGRYRDYGPADIERLRFVRRGRELGFSLDEIRALLSLAPRQDLHCDEVRDIAAGQLASVRSRISDLRKMEKALSSLVGQCKRSDQNICPVVESLAGKGGPV